MERPGDATFQGQPLTVIGPRLKSGDAAPEFELLANDLTPVRLSQSTGKVRLIAAVPSLDTPVCDLEVRTFNKQLEAYLGRVQAYTVSADLPFAQARWCGAAGVQNIQSLSDHRDMSFGDSYGTHIKELRLESRAVFVVDAEGVIHYVEYVKEITNSPDYDAALNAVKSLLA
ncbi:MAG TPA: thiol peroxidase [Candidatus Bathyarchaeia archaeon]|nr:thiol peroxidase [Candidatus Bathyarchaeia archaeon]